MRSFLYGRREIVSLWLLTFDTNLFNNLTNFGKVKLPNSIYNLERLEPRLGANDLGFNVRSELHREQRIILVYSSISLVPSFPKYLLRFHESYLTRPSKLELQLESLREKENESCVTTRCVA